MIRKYAYFIAKYNSVEFLNAFNYSNKLLISHSVVTLWLAYSSLEECYRFIILTNNSIQLFIRDIGVYCEINFPIWITQ